MRLAPDPGERTQPECDPWRPRPEAAAQVREDFGREVASLRQAFGTGLTNTLVRIIQ